MRDLHAAVKLARDNAHECQLVAVVRIHTRLHLEHDARKIIRRLALFDDSPLAASRRSGNGSRVGLAGTRCRSQLAESVQDLVDTPVQHGGGENHRRGVASEVHLLVVVSAIGGK